jgi:hypothetical protein
LGHENLTAALTAVLTAVLTAALTMSILRLPTKANI